MKSIWLGNLRFNLCLFTGIPATTEEATQFATIVQQSKWNIARITCSLLPSWVAACSVVGICIQPQQKFVIDFTVLFEHWFRHKHKKKRTQYRLGPWRKSYSLAYYELVIYENELQKMRCKCEKVWFKQTHSTSHLWCIRRVRAVSSAVSFFSVTPVSRF